MTVQPGGYAPVVQGELVTPAAVLDPKSMPVHNFAEVLRKVLTKLPGVFTHENELHAALNAVDAFERVFLPQQDRPHVAQETDMAAREDVTKRKPPITGAAPVPAAGPAIDYNALAKAILTAQQQMQQENNPPQANPPAPYGGNQ